MKMVRLNIITEGQTEETYVRDILYDHLATFQVYSTPITLATSVRERTYRGGHNHKYEIIRKNVLRSLKDRNAIITTMIDFYGIPHDFPGMDLISGIVDPYAKIRIIEQEFMNDIDHRNFIPYIQLHEYEALLFSDIEVIDRILQVICPSKIQDLRAIIQRFPNPETINNDPNTAPSKRLLKLYSPYQKITHGVQIAKTIPFDTIRTNCRHFNEWIEKLEALENVINQGN
jgi:hypothetical protein